MRKSILTLGIAAVLTGVLATCSMTYAADDELARTWNGGTYGTDHSDQECNKNFYR